MNLITIASNVAAYLSDWQVYHFHDTSDTFSALPLSFMILLDEPELGLHLYAMQLLAGMMRSVADKTQIITCSQSVTFANQFEWQDLIIVEQQQV
ncbi:hypothetical protein [Candidatus Marithrix sp. Canyon 246]|uniref:hypothetical protein n=1 Tax=Candidatus Marithrix sp. Canyon 246 TaxID=1827136 RepID=UPI00084A1519|nr:hypothetical protein [Candidatus Marithrix sp. Canyon 246]